MQNFTQYSPTEIVFGKNAELKTAVEIKRWGGSKVLIVYGGGSTIDTAKGIAYGAARPECKLWDLWTKKNLSENHCQSDVF